MSESTQLPLTVVVLAKNEAENLPRCLRALSRFDEVVVVDDRSTDDSKQIAEQHGARVLDHPFESFAKQRNWALSEGDLKHEWVLMLDADEVATEEFSEAIREAIGSAGPEVAAFAVCRKTMLFDNWLRYSDGFPVWIMRVVHRGRAWFEDQGHGEVPVPVVDGHVEKIREPFLHFAFSKGLSNWIDRHNRYSTNEAKLEFQEVKPFRWREFVASESSVRRSALRCLSRRLPFRMQLRFYYQYLWKWGFLDGRAGLTFCRLMAWYEGMIVAKREELRARAKNNLNDLEEP